MFFLVRSAFWLGLVFSAMEWPGEGPLVPPANELAAAAASRAGALCTQAPMACLEAARRFQEVSRPAEAPAGKRKSDTLDSADRAPAWRGRG